ncbi:MAG: hypothetical protein WBB36_00015 [Chitinophagales bacterium]|nr:hypothetical protein [Saprospiraceae bacterium]
MRLKLSITMLVFALFTTMSMAQHLPGNGNNNNNGNNLGNWRIIGTVTAGNKADHDVLTLSNQHDDFRQLKIKVTNSAVNIQRMVVIYDSGEPDNIDVREELKDGGETRPLDLKGGKRSLRKIEFWYDSKGFMNGKANLTVFGQK